MSEPVDKAVTVALPLDLPFIDVGGLSIPDIGSLSPEDLTDEEAKNPAIPGIGTGVTAADIEKAASAAISGAMASVIAKAEAQEQAVDDTMSEPDGLGAIFISKFPFSIPWDVAKAVGLLAAPPVTPRWEMDFMSPISGRVGGFRGDTTVVIDFGEYPIVGVVTRWFSTVMFIYALASGTKRLIWTA